MGPGPYSPYARHAPLLCAAFAVRAKEYVAAPNFPAGRSRVRTRPPACAPLIKLQYGSSAGPSSGEPGGDFVVFARGGEG